MKYISVPATAGVISLGHRGEHLARTLVFDVGDWVETYGEGAVQLLHQRAGDDYPYPCAVTLEGASVSWAVTAADTAQSGRGRLELRWYVGETLAKSSLYVTQVAFSLTDDTAEPPEAQQGWVDQVLAAANEAAALVCPPVLSEADTWLVWNKEAGAYEDSGVSATGPQGEQGKPGADGVSPTAQVTQTETGAVITVTDPSGTTTATITNGKDGNAINGLPAVTADDNDKILQVVEGAWAVLALADSAVAAYVDSYIDEAMGGEY